MKISAAKLIAARRHGMIRQLQRYQRSDVLLFRKSLKGRRTRGVADDPPEEIFHGRSSEERLAVRFSGHEDMGQSREQPVYLEEPADGPPDAEDWEELAAAGFAYLQANDGQEVNRSRGARGRGKPEPAETGAADPHDDRPTTLAEGETRHRRDGGKKIRELIEPDTEDWEELLAAVDVDVEALEAVMGGDGAVELNSAEESHRMADFADSAETINAYLDNLVEQVAVSISGYVWDRRIRLEIKEEVLPDLVVEIEHREAEGYHVFLVSDNRSTRQRLEQDLPDLIARLDERLDEDSQAVVMSGEEYAGRD